MLEKTLERTARPNQSILKEIKPEYSLEGLMLKLQNCGHLLQRADSLEKSCCWEQLRAREKEGNKMRWLDGINGHEFEQTVRDSEGQGSLVCCSSWDSKESDTT